MKRSTMQRVTILTLAMAGAVFGQVRPKTARTFASPEEASQALIDAAMKNDSAALADILGSEAKGMLTTGDGARDEAERKAFGQLASAHHKLEPSALRAGVMILLIGDNMWPFPVPLVRENQQWHFEPAMGSLEVRARRVGTDEFDAIEICAGYVEAQQKFAEEHRSGAATMEYARAIMNGLYKPGGGPELVTQGFAEAAVDAPGQKAKPYHGYYFRVLTEQGSNAPGGPHKYLAGKFMIGGFGLIAWPAEYGVTGVHTFIVNQDNTVYEKDMGAQTATLAPAITRYDPDNSWMPVD